MRVSVEGGEEGTAQIAGVWTYSQGVRGGVLSYDGMQEAWEGVLLRRGVVRAVAEMVVWGVWGFVRRMVWHLPARAVTDVVNAAVFTGPGERGMEAVVVKL